MQIDKLRGKQLDDLFDAILTLETREECYLFFDDLCTVNELQSLSQRLLVAKMIKQGHMLLLKRNQVHLLLLFHA
ncbi:Uncharacterized protein conserved in bacteria [Macrococcoides caseolyticum]|nr:Uncharacterized protein conserved in bacteria [Macrococcus caseolyticus]